MFDSVNKASQNMRTIWRDAGHYELRETRKSESGYRPHLHDTFSIGQILSGKSVCSIAGKESLLCKGSCVWIKAGDIHSCNPLNRNWSYRMLHIQLTWLNAQGLTEPASACTNGKIVFNLYQNFINQLLLNPLPLALDEKILLLLGYISKSKLGQRPVLSANQSRLQQVREYITANACRNIQLSELAKIAKLSPWQFLRVFQKQYSITPHALQLSLRINRARSLLRDGESLAEVALETGFADQSHFTRIFKRFVSQSPGSYKRSLRR